MSSHWSTTRSRRARVVTGVKRLPGAGWFYAPTLLADVTPGARIYAQEVFGPVAVLHRVVDLSEAIEMANDTAFGANLWSDDPAGQERFGVRSRQTWCL